MIHHKNHLSCTNACRKQFGSKTVVVLYGSPGEVHETAFKIPRSHNTETSSNVHVEGDALMSSLIKDSVWTILYKTTGQRVVVNGNLVVYIVDRNTAYKFWVPDLPGKTAFNTDKSVLVKGPYLVRSANIKGSTLNIVGDLNATVPLEVYAGDNVNQVTFNGQKVPVKATSYGAVVGTLNFKEPKVSLPKLSSLSWVRRETPLLRGDTADLAINISTVSPRYHRNILMLFGHLQTSPYHLTHSL